MLTVSLTALGREFYTHTHTHTSTRTGVSYSDMIEEVDDEEEQVYRQRTDERGRTPGNDPVPSDLV